MKIRDMIPVGWHKEDLMGPDSLFSTLQEGFLTSKGKMNRVFKDLSQTAFNFSPAYPGWWSSFAEVMPHVDIYEDENTIEITTELPGMDEKDIDISFAHGLLTMKGEKKAERTTNRKDYLRTERSYGSFQRSIPIPFDIEKDKIDASFKKGVLTIKLPKNPTTQGEKIAVRAE